MTQSNLGFPVLTPDGAQTYLLTEDEVNLWEQQGKKYSEDFNLQKLNDLALVGAILSQRIIMYRAQQLMAGLEVARTEDGVPTGGYAPIEAKKLKTSDIATAQKTITESANQIREIEKALGIDKKTRESGGAQTVANYLENAKRAAHQFGVRINERIKEYEKVMMEARWKLRLLENGDAEDLAYEDLSPDKFIAWLRKELADIEEKDKQWAKSKGVLFSGKL